MRRICPALPSGFRTLGHRWADVDLEDPNFEHTTYDEYLAYGCSKLRIVLFAVEFDRRYKALGIRATALHPGASQTEFSRHSTLEMTEHRFN
jgi:NAD(P)-dependent dehydrogenase (short-subunit alcohol dehydrogenase family)